MLYTIHVSTVCVTATRISRRVETQRRTPRRHLLPPTRTLESQEGLKPWMACPWFGGLWKSLESQEGLKPYSPHLDDGTTTRLHLESQEGLKLRSEPGPNTWSFTPHLESQEGLKLAFDKWPDHLSCLSVSRISRRVET